MKRFLRPLLTPGLAAGLFFVALLPTAQAIKIVVPDQYKEQVDSAKAAERAERERELDVEGRKDSAADAGSAEISESGTEQPSEQAAELTSDDFVMQSVVEAETAAAAFEGTLAEDQGLVSGQVLDKESGAPVAGAAIIIEGTNIATVTGADGRYSLGPVSAGKYTLSFIKTGYIEANITEYQIAGGEISVFPFALPPRPADMSDEVYELQDFTVTAEEANQMMALIDLKQTSVGTLDFLSSKDFDRFIGSDVADFVSRLAGVNVVEGKFAVVRGLGDRYNSTTLNGLPVPSSDPVRQGVQLDLFPTSAVETIISSKTFLPHLPATSSGAAFDLITNSYPDNWEFSLSAGVKTNSYAEESLLVNPNFEHPAGVPTGDDFSIARLLGRDLVDFRDGAFSADTAPNSAIGGRSFSFSAGNTFEDVFGFHKIGFTTSIRNSVSSKTLLGGQHDKFGQDSAPPDQLFFPSPFPPDFIIVPIPARPGSFTTDNPLPVSGLIYDLNQSEITEDASFQVGGGITLDEEENHKIDLAFFRSVVAISEATRRDNGFLPDSINSLRLDRGFGSDGSQDPILTADIVGRDYYGGNNLLTHGQDYLRHEVRTLESLQVSGSHKIPLLERDLELSWGLTNSSAKSDTGSPDPLAYVAGESTMLYLQNVSGRELLGTDFSQRNPGVTVPDGGYIFADGPSLTESFSEEVIRSTARSIDDQMEGYRYDLKYTLTDKLDVKGGSFQSETTRRVDQVDQLFLLGAPVSSDSLDGLAEESFLNLAQDYSLNSFADVRKSVKSEYFSFNFRPFERVELESGARLTDVDMSADGIGFLSNLIDLFGPLGALSSPIDGDPSRTNGELLGYTSRKPGIIDESFLLPAASLKVDLLENFDVRIAYGKTIALPSARELSPVFTVDSLSGDRIFGNPALKHSEIDNQSISFTYRDNSDRFSAGLNFFSKEITEPIEQIALVETRSGIPFQSWINNDNDATVDGVEFETQVGLDYIFEKVFFLSDEENFSIFRHFTIGGNVAKIDAEVAFPDSIKSTFVNQFESQPGHEVSPTTSTQPGSDPSEDLTGQAVFPGTRRLFDQPEFTYNLYLSFDHEDLGTSATLSLYGQSDVLTAVGGGSNKSLDQYTNPFEQLDLTISQKFGKDKNWKLSFSVENLTDTSRGVSYRRTEGNYSNADGDGQLMLGELTIDRISYKVGRTFTLSLSAEF